MTQKKHTPIEVNWLLLYTYLLSVLWKEVNLHHHVWMMDKVAGIVNVVLVLPAFTETARHVTLGNAKRPMIAVMILAVFTETASPVSQEHVKRHVTAVEIQSACTETASHAEEWPVKEKTTAVKDIPVPTRNA